MSKVLYAIPAVKGKLSQHFGHSENFVIIETENNVITNEFALNPPEHVPGAYPSFLSSHGVNFIIAGGMGQRAIDIFYSKWYSKLLWVQIQLSLKFLFKII